MNEPMRVNVKLFAILREKAQTSQLALDLPSGATAQIALAQVIEQLPALKELAAKAALAVNQQYVRANHSLAEGDELAIIPPVSGGCD